MKRTVTSLFCALFITLKIAPSHADFTGLTKDEIEATLRLGPWPPVVEKDPSNKVSGDTEAINLGRRIFSNPSFSKNGTVSCATCHNPDHGFTEQKSRAELSSRLDRNTQSLLNVKYQRWFSWDGSHDNLWAQSFAPLLKSNEMDLPSNQLRTILSETEFKSDYSNLFGPLSNQSSDDMFVSVGKALAAYIETLNTEKTPFDHFRDALEKNNKQEILQYPINAKRGLKIFLGKGNCTFCHSGPLFSNGEFHDAGVPYFIENGRVDKGRYIGLKNLRSSPYTLDGKFSDDRTKTGAWKVRTTIAKHSDFGTFRVPSLRNVEQTAPYMHDGSLETLNDVVDHYSNIDLERMHSDGEIILKPLKLNKQETADLVAFLKTLTAPNPKH